MANIISYIQIDEFNFKKNLYTEEIITFLPYSHNIGQTC